jgi:Tol biopolymer transport system component
MKRLGFIFIFVVHLLFQARVAQSDQSIEEYPAFSPDGTRLAFVSNKTGQYHIWIKGTDGKNLKEVSKLSHDIQPSWSPDGKQIAFVSYGKTKQAQRFAVWIINADGSNPHQLIEPSNDGFVGDQYPHWSPDGKYIVWNHGKQLWIAESDGKNPHPLIHPNSAIDGYGARWSPNGNLIAFVSKNIWLVQPNGQGARILSKDIKGFGLKWSKDGKYIYFNSGTSIMKIDLEAKESAKKIIDLPSEYSNFDIAADERLIAYDDTGPDTNTKLFLKKLP